MKVSEILLISDLLITAAGLLARIPDAEMNVTDEQLAEARGRSQKAVRSLDEAINRRWPE